MSACGGDEASSGQSESAQSAEPLPGLAPLDDRHAEAVRRVVGPIFEGAGDVRYASAVIDLNGDGGDEILVYPMGSAACGRGGCTLLVLTERDGRYVLFSRTSVVQTPVFAAESRSNGWRDLIVRMGGNGVVGRPLRKLVVNRRYNDNASLAESAGEKPRGELLMAANITAERAPPLNTRPDDESDSARFAGVYRGVLPCASCPGIETTLTLMPEGRFELEEAYQEEDSEPFLMTGQWRPLEDAEIDNTLILEPDDQNEAERYFLLDDEGATQLDSDGQPIDSDLDYRLSKTSGG
ncbi:MAG: copper resistance protein NlpE [Pseudomonadota bacterium]